MIQSYLAPAFVEPRELYKAFGYEDVIEVYSHIVCGYTPINLGKIIKDAILSDIEGIHRVTIDRAVERKMKRNSCLKPRMLSVCRKI